MRQSGVVRGIVVVTLLLVLAELFLQARNYAWLTDYFEGQGGIHRSVEMPVEFVIIRVVWSAAVLMLWITAVVAVEGARRWLVVGALGAVAGSLWLTPSRMILPWQDPDTTHADIGQPDTAYKVALVLVALAAAVLASLLLTPRKSA